MGCILQSPNVRRIPIFEGTDDVQLAYNSSRMTWGCYGVHGATLVDSYGYGLWTHIFFVFDPKQSLKSIKN